MSMISSIHGRVTKPPTQRLTKTGKPMTTASVAVDVTGRDGEDAQTLWVSLMCFSDQAEQLAKVGAGESVSAFGRMTRGQWTTQTGEVRESWSMLADGLITTRSARPGQSRKQSAGTDRAASAPRRERWEREGDEIAF